MTAASPTLGVVFGGAAAFLEVQLAALESTTTGKIISAPKVVTMEGIKATIKQGAMFLMLPRHQARHLRQLF